METDPPQTSTTAKKRKKNSTGKVVKDNQIPHTVSPLKLKIRFNESVTQNSHKQMNTDELKVPDADISDLEIVHSPFGPILSVLDHPPTLSDSESDLGSEESLSTKVTTTRATSSHTATSTATMETDRADSPNPDCYVDFSTPPSNWGVDDGSSLFTRVIVNNPVTAAHLGSTTPTDLLVSDLALSDCSSESSLDTIIDDDNMYRLYHPPGTPRVFLPVATTSATPHPLTGENPSPRDLDSDDESENADVVTIVIPWEDEDSVTDAAAPSRILVGKLLKDLQKISLIEDSAIQASFEGALRTAHKAFASKLASIHK
jgi:hypothetical protein